MSAATAIASEERPAVRAAVLSDLGQLMAMAKAYHYKARLARLVRFEDCVDSWADYFTAIISGARADSVVVVVDAGGELLGALTLHLMPLFMAPSTVLGTGGMLWVVPEHRGNGVFNMLNAAAEAWYLSKGAKGALASATASLGRKGSGAAFRSAGYVNEQDDYLKVFGGAQCRR